MMRWVADQNLQNSLLTETATKLRFDLRMTLSEALSYAMMSTCVPRKDAYNAMLESRGNGFFVIIACERGFHPVCITIGRKETHTHGNTETPLSDLKLLDSFVS